MHNGSRWKTGSTQGKEETANHNFVGKYMLAFLMFLISVKDSAGLKQK